MPHLHTEPGQHDLTVSVFIVRIDTPEPTILLHMHKKLCKLMQFGGHVELHETPWQALVHELREESGYELDQLKLLQPQVRIKQLKGVALHPVPFVFHTARFSPELDHYHSDIEYLAIASAPPRHAVAGGESTDMQLLTLEQIHKLPKSMIVENVRQTGIFVLEFALEFVLKNAFDTTWEAVPATDFAA